MKLTVATPFDVVLETEDAAHVRAEDATGAFGILTGHADFLSALPISVVTWRDRTGVEHHVAVRGGLLRVEGGSSVEIATREAVVGDDLAMLESEVLDRFRRNRADEQSARTDAHRLYLAAIQKIFTVMRPMSPGVAGASEPAP